MIDASVFRILDANLNRSREACRVLDDAVRFLLDDPAASAFFKAARAELARLAAPHRRELLAARDSAGDVGREADRPGKRRRDVSALVAANFGRLAEALRSIEEYGRVVSPALSNAACRLRFRAYDAEKALAVRLDRPGRIAAARLYVILTEAIALRPLEAVARAALAGGAGALQLREKSWGTRKLVRVGRRLLNLARRRGALLIVNDRVDAARSIGADGVHLGRKDMPLSEARRILGDFAFLGATTHSIAEARAALRHGADYLSCGPMFPTDTKPDVTPRGFWYARALERLSDVPVFAIGGITPLNVTRVLSTGLRHVAVCSSVIATDEPERAARAFLRKLERVQPPPAGPDGSKIRA